MFILSEVGRVVREGMICWLALEMGYWGLWLDWEVGVLVLSRQLGLFSPEFHCSECHNKTILTANLKSQS